MGSNETATATTGGPRVIGVFAGNGAPSGPNYTLSFYAEGPWRSLEVGLVVGSRLHRIRRRLGPSERSGTNCQAIHGSVSCMVERIGRFRPRARAQAV